MKKIMIVLLLLVLVTDIPAQQTTPVPAVMKQDYMQKSRRQKTAAWILLGGGVALSTGGIIWALEGDWSSNDSGPDILFFTGVASMLGSIPVFIASARNKRKARQLVAVIKMEQYAALQQHALTRASYPSAGIQLRLPVR
ncbi:hypothetical protein LL912_15900 [Niabella sp. CC-SYL272]|uniref:hypothetical protein n=1 Tax=Niabella agricola TaxID=2891571 RepID=UPI001F18D157|nr:hypothetical protein [Niabella agricola]MCF3110268.1 hypothetical protein [Niabella agricola]